MNQTQKELLRNLEIEIHNGDLDLLNWDHISKKYILTEEFIRVFKGYINWHNISKYQKLSERFISEFLNNLHWSSICKNQQLSVNFIKKFEHKIDWMNISCNKTLTEDIIREYENEINWNIISFSNVLSEDSIREFEDKVTWPNVSEREFLSEDFIREFSHKLLDFFFFFQDKINWNYYFLFQTAEVKIIKKFVTKTVFTRVEEIMCAHLNEQEKLEIQKMMALKNLFNNKTTIC